MSLSSAGECGFKNNGLQPLVIADTDASLENRDLNSALYGLNS